MAPKSFPPPITVEQVQPVAVTGAPSQVVLLSPQNASPEASGLLGELAALRRKIR